MFVAIASAVGAVVATIIVVGLELLSIAIPVVKQQTRLWP
jgi:hypothetical protein